MSVYPRGTGADVRASGVHVCLDVGGRDIPTPAVETGLRVTVSIRGVLPLGLFQESFKFLQKGKGRISEIGKGCRATRQDTHTRYKNREKEESLPCRHHPEPREDMAGLGDQSST